MSQLSFSTRVQELARLAQDGVQDRFAAIDEIAEVFA